LIFIN